MLTKISILLFFRGMIFLYFLFNLILNLVGISFLEYSIFNYFVYPRFISADFFFTKFILILLMLFVFAMYLIALGAMYDDSEDNKTTTEKGNVSFAIKSFFYVCLVCFFSCWLLNSGPDQEDIKHKNIIEKEVVQNISDYSKIPSSVYRQFDNKDIFISSTVFENGVVISKSFYENGRNKENLFFIKPDLSYVEVREYETPEDVDTYIQKEIIQKFTSYEDIKGTYYSPVGDKSLIVTEYEDNKVLKVDKFNLKYVINSDLSYSKVG